MFKRTWWRCCASVGISALVMFCAALLPGYVQAGEAGTVLVSMTGFVNDAGHVQCGLFDRQDVWRDESKAQKVMTARIESKHATCQFGEVAPGRYAVAVFHAQENESRVQYGLFGKPLQGVGFSNNPSITWGPPSFEDAAFSVGQEPVKLDVQMKY